MTDRFPFPAYPNGWFQVAYSDEVAHGAVLPLRYFGKDLVLFRAEDGAAHVLDAYCAHLGAHLGHGGKVEGNCLVCPFHAWRWNGQGECTSIPYAQRIPPRAMVAPRRVIERNGLIMVHHHLGGQAPAWEPPVLPEYGSDEWTPYEKRRWKIKSRNQEMAENATDSAHFRYVHGTPEVPTTRAEVHGHVLHVVSNTKMITRAGQIDGSIEVHGHGFGFGLTRFRGLVETLLVSSSTPIDEDYVDVRFSFTIRRLGNVDATRGVGAAFIREIERQMGQDIPIWENKAYFEHPVLCDGDGPLGLFRRWVQQFYRQDPLPPASA